MPAVGTPSFDQLRVFLTVVDEGSFAAAGRRLNRATSAISYAVANMERQLGLELFDRQSTRKPRLTTAGQAVLSDARLIAHGFDRLQGKANGLQQGLEAELHLAVDVMLPTSRLADILRRFAATFPTVTLRLSTEALGAVTALVLEGRATVGVSGPIAVAVDGLEHVALGSVPMVPVAAPSHPLAQAGELPAGASRAHIQLVLSDRSRLTEGRDYAVLSPRTWRLADLGSKHHLLREGIGWGNMPLPLVESDLASGALVRLRLPEHRGGTYRLDGIYRSAAPPGPAGSWLLQQLAESGQQDVEEPGFADM